MLPPTTIFYPCACDATSMDPSAQFSSGLLTMMVMNPIKLECTIYLGPNSCHLCQCCSSSRSQYVLEPCVCLSAPSPNCTTDPITDAACFATALNPVNAVGDYLSWSNCKTNWQPLTQPAAYAGCTLGMQSAIQDALRSAESAIFSVF